jgi:hypothetical protein
MTGSSNRQLAEKFQRASGAGRPVDPNASAGDGAVQAARRLSKFTVNLEPRDAEDFDALVLTARRALGHRVDKSEIVRALIALMGRDAALRQEVHELIRDARQRPAAEVAREQ